MAPSSRATIVVVERNSAAQELIDQTLREHGHRVLVTMDPLEALNLAERVRIDLLSGTSSSARKRQTSWKGFV